jgi:hypothetical protein
MEWREEPLAILLAEGQAQFAILAPGIAQAA